LNIVHHISFLDREKTPFQAAGIELPPSLDGLITLDIGDDDPRWKALSPIVEELRIVDMAYTRFSLSELNNARFLKMGASWHHGYPQPENSYKELTYNLSNYCEVCGIGKRQKAPFRMKKPPNWGRRSILQMNWVFDEYFVKPDVWQAVFKPFGIASKPVLLDKTGKEIESVVQLDNSRAVDLQMGDRAYGFEECSKCGRRKYLPRITGFFPAPAPTNSALFRSTQYFGSGASAHNAVLISATLYQKIKKADLKGAEFQACGDPDGRRDSRAEDAQAKARISRL
jgi:hypothetical protein